MIDLKNILPNDFNILNKIAYGFTKNEIELFSKIGFKNYIEQQLNPNDDQEAPSVSAKLKALRLHIDYHEKGKKVNEHRPLEHYYKNAADLWRGLYNDTKPYQEKYQPAVEIMATTWIKAVYSRWQLREIMVLFWHNHFNISVDKDVRIALTMPLYDKDVIRRHALGNFRAFLEAVAQSAAMQFYLNNASSQASPANENYARELFELHTLGREAYLNNLYNRWQEVPGAKEGKPIGYIDEDVYEAARAFTGWTIADGTDNGKGGAFPDTGAFHYYEGWHDNYQKRILGVELPPNQPPMADGKKVLDLVAYHPATARHICKKLCQRFIDDTPTEGVIQKAIDIFIKNKNAPDQIKQVLSVILLSDECQKSIGQKTKTPFELVASFLRSTEADFLPNNDFFWLMSQTGYTLFRWPSPTGHPDRAPYWLNPNMMLNRWNIINILTADWHKATKHNIKTLIPNIATLSCLQISEFLLKKMLYTEGPRPDGSTSKLKNIIANYLADGGTIDEPPILEEKDFESKILQAIALIGMSPEFQYR
jgi:uncharacterized protein (DUF1800 family)